MNLGESEVHIVPAGRRDQCDPTPDGIAAAESPTPFRGFEPGAERHSRAAPRARSTKAAATQEPSGISA